MRDVTLVLRQDSIHSLSRLVELCDHDLQFRCPRNYGGGLSGESRSTWIADHRRGLPLHLFRRTAAKDFAVAKTNDAGLIGRKMPLATGTRLERISGNGIATSAVAALGGHYEIDKPISRLQTSREEGVDKVGGSFCSAATWRGPEALE